MGAAHVQESGEEDVQIRLGYELIYECQQFTPMILALNVHYTRASDLVRPDYLVTDPPVPVKMYRDGFGNWCSRIVAPPGRFRLTTDALINDRGEPESVPRHAEQHAVESLPEETLVYLLGSRYCDTDHLSTIAWDLFGKTGLGWQRVQAVCDFVHQRITFGYQYARPPKTAWEDKASVETSPTWPSRCVGASISRRGTAPVIWGISACPPWMRPWISRAGSKPISAAAGTHSTPATTSLASVGY